MLDPLTLDQLRVLITIAEEGSFSAAARRLKRVQSAISQSVRTLEATLEIVIFDRAGRTPMLTPAGAALVEDARKLLRDAAALKARARGMAQGLEPELTLSVDPLFPMAVLMQALRAFEREFPTLPVRLITAGLGAPERHLREGAAALAIYALETTGAKDLVATFLVEIEVIPVVAADHPLARLPPPVGREALSEHVQLVLSDFGATSWTKGIVGHRIWRFADPHVRLGFLLGGFGWCNMARHLAAPALADGRLALLDVREQSGFRIALQAVYASDRPPGPGGRALIRMLHALIEADAPGQAGSGLMPG